MNLSSVLREAFSFVRCRIAPPRPTFFPATALGSGCARECGMVSLSTRGTGRRLTASSGLRRPVQRARPSGESPHTMAMIRYFWRLQGSAGNFLERAWVAGLLLSDAPIHRSLPDRGPGLAGLDIRRPAARRPYEGARRERVQCRVSYDHSPRQPPDHVSLGSTRLHIVSMRLITLPYGRDRRRRVRY